MPGSQGVNKSFDFENNQGSGVYENLQTDNNAKLAQNIPGGAVSRNVTNSNPVTLSL